MTPILSLPMCSVGYNETHRLTMEDTGTYPHGSLELPWGCCFAEDRRAMLDFQWEGFDFRLEHIVLG